MSTSKSHLFKKGFQLEASVRDSIRTCCSRTKRKKGYYTFHWLCYSCSDVSGKVTWPEHVQSEWELGFVPGPARKALIDSTGYILAAVIGSGSVTWPDSIQSEWASGLARGADRKASALRGGEDRTPPPSCYCGGLWRSLTVEIVAC